LSEFAFDGRGRPEGSHGFGAKTGCGPHWNWRLDYGLIAYLRMGFAASVFIALPTMVLAIGFAVLGFVRKERPLWPAMVAISMITIPLCIELLEVATDLLEWLVRQ
jgi:hypothetical protein